MRLIKSLAIALDTTSYKPKGKRTSINIAKYLPKLGRRYSRRCNMGSTKINVNMVILGLIIFLILLTVRIITKPKSAKGITAQNVASMKIPTGTLSDIEELSLKNNVDFAESVALFCIDNMFFPDKNIEFTKNELQRDFFSNYTKFQQKYIKTEYNQYIDLVERLINDIKIFPIPEGFGGENSMYMFGDTWGEVRTYGGTRTHEGTDIIDRDNIRGRIPIVSMTGGTVQNMGWNEKGGWRVGIVSTSGIYYYYAHLERYANNIQIGSAVEPGTLLGYMGDTGYSKKEGTTGNFPVHLHLGISLISSSMDDEFWINPYPFLRYIESKKISL